MTVEDLVLRQRQQNDQREVEPKRPQKAPREQKMMTFSAYQKRETRNIRIWSFLLPMLLLALAWAAVGFFPLGGKTPLVVDLYHQYAPFLSEMRQKILGGEDLFFSWRPGLGISFYALMSYYLASPLNLLLVLFPLKNLTDAVAVLTLLKIGICGLTMAYFIDEAFFNRHPQIPHFSFKSIGISRADRLLARRDGFRNFAVIGLASAYAVSGFNLTYSWNIMWFDALMIFPLMLLGMERLIKKNQPFLYIISLALVLIFNYYIAFFCVLFCALYFFVLCPTLLPPPEHPIYKKASQLPLDQEKEASEYDIQAQEADSAALRASAQKGQQMRRKMHLLTPRRLFVRKGFAFLFASLLGLGLSCFFVLPTYLSLKETSASGDAFPASANFSFQILHFLSRGLIGSSPDIRSGLPNIFCGILTLALLPVYCFNKRIPKRERALHIGFLLFMFLSLNSNVLNFIWHGMHYPNQLPHRFAFLYSTLLILMAARTLALTYSKAKPIFVYALAGLVVLAVLSEQILSEHFSSSVIYISIAVLAIYIYLATWIQKGKTKGRLVASMFFIVFMTELALNGIYATSQINENEYYTAREDFIRESDHVEQLVASAQSDVKRRAALPESAETPFFRMEYRPAKTTNDPALYHYNGFTLFASTSNEETAKFMRQMGFHSNNINSYKYVDSSVFADALFGIEYLIYGKDKQMKNHRLDQVDSRMDGRADMTLYRNKDVLPLSLAMNPEVMDIDGASLSPFALQNAIAEQGGADAVYEFLNLKSQNLKNLKESRTDAEKGYAYSTLGSGAETKLDFEIPIEKDGHAYFFIKVVRSCKINYELEHGKDHTANASEKRDSKRSGEAANLTRSSQNNQDTSTEEFEKIKDHREINKPEMFDVGDVKKGDVIKGSLSFKDENDLDNPQIWAALATDQSIDQMIQKMSQRDAGLKLIANRKLAGEVSAESDRVVMLSVPYDKGWRVYVDDQAVETLGVFKGLLGFKIGAGTHQVYLEFIPQGFETGLGISLLSLVLLLLLAVSRRFFKGPRARDTQLNLSRMSLADPDFEGEDGQNKSAVGSAEPSVGKAATVGTGVERLASELGAGSLSSEEAATLSSEDLAQKQPAAVAQGEVKRVQLEAPVLESESGHQASLQNEAEVKATTRLPFDLADMGTTEKDQKDISTPTWLEQGTTQAASTSSLAKAFDEASAKLSPQERWQKARQKLADKANAAEDEEAALGASSSETADSAGAAETSQE